MKKSLFRLAAYVLLCFPFFFFLTAAADMGGGGGCNNISSSQFTVTPSGENVSIDPSDPQGVDVGSTPSFTVAANEGFTLSNTVGGTCPAGTWVGNVYTTAAIVQSCTVIFSASENAFTLGGSVAGLADGESVVLQNNGADHLTLTVDGAFTFDTEVAQGASYNVTLLTDPVLQTCLVANGSGTVGAEPVTNVTVTCAPNAYITPILSATSIDLFTIDPSTGFLDSNSTTAYSAPGSEVFGQMAFATVNDVLYAYVTNPQGAVYQCSLAADGSFSACTATASLPSLNTWTARAIAFATFDAQYAYVVDPGDIIIYQCALNVSGDFSNCLTFPSLPLGAPYGIAFATDGLGATHSYIADADSGSGGVLWLCSMQNDGSYNTCAQTPASGAPSWVPYSVAFTTVDSVQYAYVADNGTGVSAGHVYRCSLNNDGTFTNSSCIQTPSNDSALTNWYPYSITFETVGTTQYAYVVNSSGSSIGNLYRCEVDSSGLLTDCAMTPDTPPVPWQPGGIAF